MDKDKSSHSKQSKMSATIASKLGSQLQKKVISGTMAFGLTGGNNAAGGGAAALFPGMS